MMFEADARAASLVRATISRFHDPRSASRQRGKAGPSQLCADGAREAVVWMVLT